MQFDIRDHFKKIDILDKGHIELIDGMASHPLLKIVNAARVSFNKQVDQLGDDDKKLINYLYDHKHFSTFRHSYFTFRIKAPLFVFRQWWKHQIGSDYVEGDVGEIQMPETNWNEVSGRYVEWKPEFYVPKEFRKQSKNNKQGSTDETITHFEGYSLSEGYESVCNYAYEKYERMISAGVAKEQARGVIPLALYSECIWTVSLQGLLYWLDLRSDAHAQWEIRQYADSIRDLMSDMFEEMF